MAYYRPIYDPREETYVAGRQGEHMTVEEYARAAQVRTAAIVPNYSRYALARGMYQDLNTVYNDICPNPQRDDNLYQQMGQIYSQQYNSPIDPAQSQLSVVPYGIHNSGQNRTFSPGMSGSNNDLRNMGMISHVSPPNDPHYPASSHDLTTVASRPDLQWMVTTSNIDMRTVTPPNAMVSHAGQYNPGLTSNVTNSSMADISHHPPPPYGRIQSSLRSHRDIGPSSSTGISHRGPGSRNHKSSLPSKPKGTPGRKRKVEDHQLTPEEASKRHLRRERNKLAAAKCRNRRRELTDRLQGETDILEDHQGMLTQEIVALQQEKDHLEFILASHTPVCKVLTTKHMNQSDNLSPVEPRSSCHDNMVLQGDNGANLIAPMEMNSDFGHLTSPISDVHPTLHHHNVTNDHPQQATTVSVITAGPSLPPNSDNRMNQTSYSRHHNNSVIVGKENMSGSYSTIQPEDLSTVNHLNSSECRRYPATLCNIDVLDQVSCEPLNTPVCSLATPSNTSAVFTFPNTACMTSNSSSNTTGINFSDTFSVPASLDYSSSSIMTTGMNNNFSIPSQISSSYTAISSHSVITSASQRETCSAAHRRSSSSESHHSPDSVQSPKLLSL